MNMAEPIPKTVVERVLMAMENLHLSRKQQTRVAHMNGSLFSLVSRLIILSKESAKLTLEERGKVEEALSLINQGDRKQALALVSKILFEHGMLHASKGIKARARARRKNNHRYRQRLESTIFGIREACTNNDELKIPPLDHVERLEMIAALDDCVAAIIELRKRIKTDGEKDHDQEPQGI